jgi:uncharacterized protein (TIGR02145 family)
MNMKNQYIKFRPILFWKFFFFLIISTIISCSAEKDETPPNLSLTYDAYSYNTNELIYKVSVSDNSAIKSIYIYKNDSLFNSFEAITRSQVASYNDFKVYIKFETKGFKVRAVIKDFGGNITEKTLNSPTSISNGIVADVEGNVYKTVTIGSQIWMAENLRATKYRNGNDIANVINNFTWASLSTGAWCDYSNFDSRYGHLYNWYAVSDSRNIAPIGWHIPTDAEWTTLTTYLGGESVAGGKLKCVGYSDWGSPNTGATNETGFNALPGGLRGYDGTFSNLGFYGNWWSASMNGINVWYRNMDYYKNYVYRNSIYMNTGFSVRCIRNK